MNINYTPGSFRKVFWSPYEQYKDRVGQTFEVLGHNVIAEDELEQDTGVRPDLYCIRFSDGFEISAWGEEICVEENE